MAYFSQAQDALDIWSWGRWKDAIQEISEGALFYTGGKRSTSEVERFPDGGETEGGSSIDSFGLDVGPE